MGLFSDAVDEVADSRGDIGEEGERPGSGTVRLAERSSTVTVAGEEVPVAGPNTKQTAEDTWLTGKSSYGWPRQRDALEARQIQQTAAMETITNGIVGQLLGGELTFESDDDGVGGPEEDLRDLLRDVLTGPHLMDDTLDDLITAAVVDMLGPGNAYWQLLGPESGSADLPVVSMVPLDAMTIRHNYERNGMPGEPAYWQAQTAFAGGEIGTLQSLDPTPLGEEDLVMFRYPYGRRSFQIYPKSPAQQVRDWLELLSNSTTHHSRFYSDNEVPPGFLQVMGGRENTIDTIKTDIENAKGDPRSVPVVGGEGAAQWIEMGGTAINLSVIEEQKWFFQMCLASLGLGKAEVGLIEDVNRANGEIEASRIYKRVTGPFAKQFERGFQKIASRFPIYEEMGEPFDIRLRFTDPREERAREERLRKMWQAGGLTYRQYIRRRGDEELADADDLAVDINGERIDYGDHPRWVVEQMLREARSDPDPEEEPSAGGDASEGEAALDRDAPDGVGGAGGGA